MRDTLTIQGEIDVAYAALDKLKEEKRDAPVSQKFASFQRSRRGNWYGPYWKDTHDRSCDLHVLVIGYSWTTAMVFSVEQDAVIYLASDMKTEIPPHDGLIKVCKDLIASPQHQ